MAPETSDHIQPIERSKKVEMNVSVVDLSANQKKLQVEIPSKRVQGELEKRYRELAKQAKIKGFRPGKVPRTILKSYYGKSVEGEVSSQFIQDTFADALREADLKPLVEAEVGEMHFEDSGSFVYEAVVDVCPPFELEGYKGLEVVRKPARVTEDQVQAELERIREQHAELRTVEPDRPIAMGDNVLIDFTPSVDGVVFQKGVATDHMLEVGKKALHDEFDEHLVGHEVGDVFTVELDYPEQAPAPEVAGKRVHFEVTVKELKEKIFPELNDEFARELPTSKYETMEELEQDIRDRLLKREEDAGKVEVRKQIMDQLLAKVEIEVSPKVIEREIDRHIEYLQNQFESQGLKIDGFRFNSPEIRAEYQPTAEKNVRWRLICSYLAKQELIELTEEEMDEIYMEVARMARMDVAQLKREYAESAIIDQAKESRIQEKVFDLLEKEAAFKQASEEESSTEQE
jgi:trigger factor